LSSGGSSHAYHWPGVSASTQSGSLRRRGEAAKSRHVDRRGKHFGVTMGEWSKARQHALFLVESDAFATVVVVGPGGNHRQRPNGPVQRRGPQRTRMQEQGRRADEKLPHEIYRRPDEFRYEKSRRSHLGVLAREGGGGALAKSPPARKTKRGSTRGQRQILRQQPQPPAEHP
jgi:hypothetical protein